ncbi:SAF domain protein OS=Tsukamurella paurometabola (strain ATCC 8368 / DSM / CCUG 35730 / CIP 100753 / JCM 10117 / KCTC 9821 / NBRC 16120 / NCIMB 702349 /NCTC 13040) OX=521096 GN=Tpau_3274 PE=4 SV=1 [Tsukamurella paurometabola]|uniref:SAF domain protein n=1 Tax=Tsukamurella paurometabola (strain ATCC 8368 / DSM 20162 / CCUG 35730 / CIP 100753 / JCM 10117 / KCTC 9821 / NBRC 16120 / NCIMB 702349 / NCTC 13040) TaxID=521096 RepID=D5UVS7_TSUPD|nr:Flp pilus assembly protein CpaB [Tsukamurella paurometabola]ADG79859.1 SAF domain protein [Tsukamurella paurometabola DSM 20162]SUP37448.1 Flp pilus assembly protein CpaB [Tsukamurella paurometabola]
MNSLQPTGAERIRAALRPGWARTLTARRAAAGVLTVLALVVAVTSEPSGPQTEVLTAARELGPGGRLADADLRLTTVPAELAPPDALTSTGQAVGRSVTGPVGAGEILTDRRVLTDRTAGQIRPGSRLVPVALQDAATMDLLRPGDVVDVVAQRKARAGEREDDGTPLVLARSATVAVAAAAQGPRQQARTAMLAMTETEAHAVAAAALSSPLSVVFR